MAPPGPIDVRHLFPEERHALHSLLAELTDDEWQLPTVCAGWTVHDLVLHLLAVDVQNLSGGRDRFNGPPNQPPPGDLSEWDALVAYINGRNVSWVEATRRMSPRLACEFLAVTGDLFDTYLQTVDLDAPSIPVSWAGPDPAPAWLHITREYTERWVHQQQIRDAVGRPGFTDPRFFAPVLDAFARALPHALRETAAPAGTVVRLVIAGDAGGTWTAVRGDDRWDLNDDRPAPDDARVTMDQDLAWRLFTKGIAPEDAEGRIEIRGNRELAAPVVRMVTIMA